ncbi:Ras GTPase [Mortierella alpina]|nr:Ras GTPase [Mortierella alpina]
MPRHWLCNYKDSKFNILIVLDRYFFMDSYASTTELTASDKDIEDVKEMHVIEPTHKRSHWRVPSFYAQLLDLEEDEIVYLTAEKLADEYERQARILEQYQAQQQPQPQSSGKKLRRQRRIMRQETRSMDDLKSELPGQQEDQMMCQIDPVQQGKQSPMKQAESVIPGHAGQRRGKGYFSKIWARIRPSSRSSSPVLCSADRGETSLQHPSGHPQKPPRSRCSRRSKGQGFIGAPIEDADATFAESTIDLFASDPNMTLHSNQSTSSLARSSFDTAVDPQNCQQPSVATSDSILAHCSTSTMSNSSIQSSSCSSDAAKGRTSFATSRSCSPKRLSRQRTDSVYSQTASSSSRSGGLTRTEVIQYKAPPRKLTIVVVGDGAVGKSAMVLRFLRDQFHDEYDPTIEDSYCKNITVDGQDYILDLTDTSGQFEYRSHWNDSFMRSADGFICVYSITSLGSFRELVGYRDQIWRAKDSEHVPIMMVGNKCDLGNDTERRVATKPVARFAERSNALYLEAR